MRLAAVLLAALLAAGGAPARAGGGEGYEEFVSPAMKAAIMQ